MVYRGVVRKGVVRLAEGSDLPDGAVVSVRLVKSRTRGSSAAATGAAPARTGWGQRLLDIAGAAEGLPSDLATNLDHYLYGLPKRETESKSARPARRSARGRG